MPAFVRELLASPPRRGDGLNNWFFRTARVLHPFLPREEIIELLQAATYGEPLQPGEIKRAVERSAASHGSPASPPCGKNTAQPTRNSISSFARP
jgi:hypothetical protein